MKSKERSIVKRVRALGAFAPSIAAALVGICLSALAGLTVGKWEANIARQAFDRSAADHVSTLQRGLDGYVEKLSALRSLFESVGDGVSRGEFARFTHDFMEESRAIIAFSWVPRVRGGDRARHELEGVDDGLIDYHIRSVGKDGRLRPAPVQDEYFPVFFSSEPATGKGFGINLKDGGIRQEPLDRAVESGLPASTGSFRLQSGTGDRTGFFVVLPVFHVNLPHTTPEERRQNLAGFVQVVFQFHVMVDAILADVKSPLAFALFEADAGAADLPVIVESNAAGRDDYAASTLREMTAGTPWVGDISVADRHWKVVVVPSAGASALVLHNGGWTVFGSSLLVTLAIVAYMLSVVRNFRLLEAANEAAYTLARRDALTGLANRLSFVEHLDKAFAATARGNTRFAVHFIDLDHFKDVNDTQGHAAGDALLVEAATRIQSCVRRNDIVARFGGDEFAVLQTDVDHPSVAGVLAGRIVATVSAPYAIGGEEFHISASVGIAIHSDEVEGPAALLIHADLALYRAKEDGRNNFRFHIAELNQQVHLRVNLSRELRTAIDNDELELHYQPQVEIASGKIVGLEALVRWTHPTRGEIRPSIFIPVAEQTGTILALGRWVLARACRQVREWEDAGLVVPLVALNVSGAQLKQVGEFERFVEATFTRWGIRRGAIELEITETVLMEATERQSDMLDRFTKLGATLAIDDFGTGYSSLKYLATYPVNRLKIAQELIAGIPFDKRSNVVVRSVVNLARDLEIECIAEGVERSDQVHCLIEMGCHLAQGHHFGRPKLAVEMARRLVSKCAPGGPGRAEISA